MARVRERSSQEYREVAASGSDGMPAKKQVPDAKASRRTSALPEIRAKVLAEMGMVVERLEQAIGRLAPVSRRRETEEGPDLGPALQEFSRRQRNALDHLDLTARRISEAATRLAVVAEQLEQRLSEPPRANEQENANGEPRTTIAEPVTRNGPPPEHNGQAVGIVVAPVLDFHGLMEMQRALSGLPAADAASVTRYKNGEASFDLSLHAQVSADEIARTLSESTGHQLLIEEWRPDEQRLRLRYVDSEH